MYRTSFQTIRSFLINPVSIKTCNLSTLVDDSPQSSSKHYQEQMKHYIAAKHRIATMMGSDPNTFTEKDMKIALRYLIPHHIRSIPSKPQILHPDVLTRRDRIEFKIDRVDQNNRPLEAGFYTTHPCYHNFHLEVIRFKKFLDSSDITFKPKKIPDLPQPPDCTLGTLLDSNLFRYAGKEAVELVVGEILRKWYYEHILVELKELIQHPAADESVLAFVRPFFEKVINIPQIAKHTVVFQHESGSQVVEEVGKRKSSSATVQVWRGEGYIIVNGRCMGEYFLHFQDALQILYPLQLIGVLGKYSVDCTVSDGGHSGQSGAIRIALAKSLAYLEPQSRDILSNAGLLWSDSRRREGKKPGRKRARRGYTWRKR